MLERLNEREKSVDLRTRSRSSWWHLQGAELFEAVSDEELESLASSSRLIRCKRRKHVQLGSGDSDGVFLLTRGSAKLCHTGFFGRRVIDSVIGAGDLFGRVSAPKGRSETYDIEALEETEILVFSRDHFSTLLERHPDLAYTVIQVLEDRERILRRRLESLMFKDVTARVAETLVELAREHGEPCTHGMAVDVRITQQDLADLVGASRQMVNRVIRRLTVSLYVVRKGRTLCILHYDRLCQLASSQD